MARVQLPESRLRARKRRRRVAVVALWATLMVFAVGGLAGLAHLPHIRIAEVTVAGLEGTEAQAVTAMAHQQLEGYYWHLLPRDNVFIYPYRAIITELYKKNAKFGKVEVRAQGLRGLEIRITQRKPHALWCGPTRGAPAPCFILDEEGVAYEAAALSAGLAFTTYFGLLPGSSLPRQYLTEEAFRSLSALAAALETHQGVRVASVEVDAAEDARLRFANGFEVIFTLKDDGGDVYERFLLALEAEPFKSHVITDFLYLDLRFGDRLYYKLKGE